MPSTMKARNALLRGPPRPRRRRLMRWEWVIAGGLGECRCPSDSPSAAEALARHLFRRCEQALGLQPAGALQAQFGLARRALGRRARLAADAEADAPRDDLRHRDVLSRLGLQHLDRP